MHWIAILFATCCIFCSCNAQATLFGNGSNSTIEQSYLVVLDGAATQEQVELHLEIVRNLTIEEGNVSNITAEIFVGTVFRGYTAIFTDDLLNQVLNMDIVDFIEVDQELSMTFTSTKCEVQCDPPWGIVRTTKYRTPEFDAYVYNPDTSGSGVDIYVLDTGIDVTHPDFGGRASFGANFASDFSMGDPNGHGTHVAGIAMSTTYGVAKEANAISVRVLNAAGFGSFASVCLGIAWVILRCCAVITLDHCNRCDECIINMSLGGPSSVVVNLLTNAAVGIGVHVAVSAGNENLDACHFSPAGAMDAVTVAASDCDDKFATFSNHGTCVDIIAPGVDIVSTATGGGNTVLSGTSQASPHVAGVMAKYLSFYIFNGRALPSPTQLREVLIATASINRIKRVPECTLNLLVFKDCSTYPICFSG